MPVVVAVVSIVNYKMLFEQLSGLGEFGGDLRTMESVLIVDDDVTLTQMLKEYLAPFGIDLTPRHDADRGLAAATSGQYKLMLLDVTMPGMDGFEILQQLRMSSDIYVMLLTARGEAADRVRGLRLGADDYLAKPFDSEELVERIRALLRRRSQGEHTADRRPKPSALRYGDFTLDLVSRSAHYGKQALDLTSFEMSLLEMFLRSPGVVLEREHLSVSVFQRPFHPLDRSLDMYVCRLRRKLQTATPLGDSIKTIRSAGYLFTTVDATQSFFASI
jgi:two-component system response regulator CpxR